MEKTLIQGVSEKDMQALVTKLNVNNFYFPSLFPLKFTPTLTWKTLEGNRGIPVAAEVVSFNSSIPIKSRPTASKVMGDIPKIGVSRIMEETDFNRYHELLHYAGTDEGQRELINMVYDDLEFCFLGVNARLEILALEALSSGKTVLSSTNSNGIRTETDINYLVPSSHKRGATAAWSNPSTAKPIKDIKDIVKQSKEKGVAKFMLMDQTTFDNMKATEEVIKYCASWILQATNLQQTPTLEAVNMLLAKENLPQIIIVDSNVMIEDKDSKLTSFNPWKSGIVTFLPSKIAGNTYHAPVADERVGSSKATKIKRGHILLQKFSELNPIREHTQGLANAFPAWSTAQQSYLLNTNGTSWS